MYLSIVRGLKVFARLLQGKDFFDWVGYLNELIGKEGGEFRWPLRKKKKLK